MRGETSNRTRKQGWCGGCLQTKMVPSVGIEPTTYRLPSHFGFRRRIGLLAGGVRGLDYPFAVACRIVDLNGIVNLHRP